MPLRCQASATLSSSLYCIGFGLVWAGIYNPPPLTLDVVMQDGLPSTTSLPNHECKSPSPQPLLCAMWRHYPSLLKDVCRRNMDTGRLEDPPPGHWVRATGRAGGCVGQLRSARAVFRKSRAVQGNGMDCLLHI